jgi:hypothetical protein
MGGFSRSNAKKFPFFLTTDYRTALTNFLAANPNINLEIPVISKFTPTNVPIAHTELDGQ